MNRVITQEAPGVWVEYSAPVAEFTALGTEEVVEVISQAESAALGGKVVFGFVSYEASSAFDASLVHHESRQIPLAHFAAYSQVRRIELPEPEFGLYLQPALKQAEYCQLVGNIKDYLSAGDTYQVNLTYQLRGRLPNNPLANFAALVDRQPSPYSFYLEADDFVILSVSPELFFELQQDAIRTEPMKGTRPRGQTALEDERLLRELQESAKDKAENLMIVDMVRNDLGKIAKPGSVTADELFTVKELPTVWQQVSSVEAKTDADMVGIFAALFPCASVTGAPKCQTMHIIKELETEPRGVYTGAVGRMGPGRTALFNVAIRTAVLERNAGTSRYGVGGGIVWDSDSEAEWEETQIKAAILTPDQADFELLETCRFDPESGIDLLDFHLERLAVSADSFGFCCDIESVGNQMDSLQSDVPLRVRLLLAPDGQVNVETAPLSLMQEPIALAVAKQPVSGDVIWLQHKTTNRWMYEEAKLDGCDDVILFNERGELTETTIFNLYLQLDGRLLTAPLESGLLAGTYRRYLLEAGKVEERILYLDDLKSAESIYVSNSVRGLLQAELIEL